MKCHYIHRNYLNRFSINSKPGTVFVFDKTTLKSFPTSTKKIAFEENFYKLPNDEQEIIERNFIKDIEDKGAKALDELLGHLNMDFLLTKSKVDLSNYISLHLIRTLEERKHLDEFADKVIEPLVNVLVKKDIPEGAKVIMNPKGRKAFHLDYMMKFIFNFAQMIYSKTWVLIFNKTNHLFYTSDNPVQLYNHLKTKSNFEGNLGLMCKGIQIMFPISPRVLLNLIDPQDGVFTDFVKIIKQDRISIYHQEKIRLYNELQTINSTRYIFSQENQFQRALTVLSKHPEYRDVNRERTLVIRGNEIIKKKDMKK